MTLEVLKGTLSVDMVGILGDVSETGEEYEVLPDVPEEQVKPDSELKKGDVIASGKASYKVMDVSKKQVAYLKPSKTNIAAATIPDAVTIKKDGKNVTFKVTQISSKAFTKCKSLKSVTIGKYVTEIGKEAFSGCQKLKKITLKTTSLKKVGKNAIKGIHKNAVIICNSKKVKAYKKLFNAKSGFVKKTMKVGAK